VWQVRLEDESGLSAQLPIDDVTSERKQPWLLHTLTVNAINFCSFTMMSEISQIDVTPGQQRTADTILIAVPGVQDGFINVVQLPSEDRVATIPTPKDVKTGMIMAIGLCYHQHALTVLAGYESGHAAIWQRNDTNHWQTVYVNKAHSQPILSLDSSRDLNCFFTSSADAIIARHPMPGGTVESKAVQTRHAGQQGLKVRSDEKIFATAGWDGRARVYSSNSMEELAVLKWHKEGCYAIAFADISTNIDSNNDDTEVGNSVIKRNLTVSEQRTEKAKSTHWLAAGSKDGKVSLWDIY
jgi:WD40 repeat protein